MFGFSDDEQQEIFDIAAGILVFSKTTFLAHIDEETKTEISVVHDSTRSYFTMAAKLWGITEDALEETLCSRLAHDKTFMPVKKIEAEKKRDMLIDSMYGSLVKYIVNRMNEEMLKTAPPKFKLEENNFLGIVDLFGVDNQSGGFNGLDQLMMNYTAEKVHQRVLQKMFKEDEALCKQEEVQISESKYSDNEQVIDFLDRRATGLLTTLATDTRFDRVTDEACLKGFLRGTKVDEDVWYVFFFFFFRSHICISSIAYLTHHKQTNKQTQVHSKPQGLHSRR